MLIIAIKTHKAWNFTTFQRAFGNKISSNSVGKLNPIMLLSFFLAASPFVLLKSANLEKWQKKEEKGSKLFFYQEKHSPILSYHCKLFYCQKAPYIYM